MTVSKRFGNEVLRAHVSFDHARGLFVATLLGGEFANAYGQGKSADDAMISLRLRVLQLRGSFFRR